MPAPSAMLIVRTFSGRVLITRSSRRLQSFLPLRLLLGQMPSPRPSRQLLCARSAKVVIALGGYAPPEDGAGPSTHSPIGGPPPTSRSPPQFAPSRFELARQSVFPPEVMRREL